MEILNLYSSLGGNRAKWGNDHNVTAIENDPELARIYSEKFPNDKVIITDAHNYLLLNYFKFDFIWTSPSCPTHSRARFWTSSNETHPTAPVFPDLKLYEEILFLKHYFKGKFCVENVVPYYEPLIPGKKRGRHLFWTNFPIPTDLGQRDFNGLCQTKNELKKLCKFHNIDLSTYEGEQRKDKIARNLVDYEAGKTILNAALGIIKKENVKQFDIFD